MDQRKPKQMSEVHKTVFNANVHSNSTAQLPWIEKRIPLSSGSCGLNYYE